ncbi:MAG: hypothetical protein OXT65_03545 [Alphaproteobacteria bacterium]|nr:hypothetical protein [Alphaproteobacteria bacterium]
MARVSPVKVIKKATSGAYGYTVDISKTAASFLKKSASNAYDRVADYTKGPRNFVKKVALDPGVVFSVADVLLFAHTNPIGLVACLAATAVSSTAKTLVLTKPKFLKSMPLVDKIVQDDRTPLRASGLALLVVAGASLAMGGFFPALAAGQLAWGALLPAAASGVFALGNFRFAESLSRAIKNDGDPVPKPEEPKKKRGKFINSIKRAGSLMLKTPELYFNTAFALAGLMAGGAAVWIFPAIVASTAISMHNILTCPHGNAAAAGGGHGGGPTTAEQKKIHKHLNRGQPKLWLALAGYIFAGIGFANGHGLIAVAHALNATVIADSAGQGIFPRLFRDVKDGAFRIVEPFASVVIPKSKRKPKPQVAPEIKKERPLIAEMSIMELFRQRASKTPAQDDTKPANDDIAPLVVQEKTKKKAEPKGPA